MTFFQTKPRTHRSFTVDLYLIGCVDLKNDRADIAARLKENDVHPQLFSELPICFFIIHVGAHAIWIFIRDIFPTPTDEDFS
jgi:hypothetical protein